jgi:hypothetical protein
MSAEQQLAILPAKEVALAVFSAPNGLDPYLQSVREEIDKFNASAPDVKPKRAKTRIARLLTAWRDQKRNSTAWAKSLLQS